MGFDHPLLGKAKLFDRKPLPEKLEGCSYDKHVGFWRFESDGTCMMKSNDPSRPVCGTKKCDIETGEDEKGE